MSIIRYFVFSGGRDLGQESDVGADETDPAIAVALRPVQDRRAVLNSDGNNQPRYVQLGLFLLANHGARVIADGPDGNTVIVGSLLIDRILFQELTNHRLLAVDHLLPCEAVALDLGDGHSAKLAVFQRGQAAALLRNDVDRGNHRRIVLLLGILGEYWC
jgi:hypothetical protein